VDIDKTLEKNTKLPETMTRQAILDNPNILFGVNSMTLVFKQSSPQKKVCFAASGAPGPERWKLQEPLPGSSATFNFTTDGDGNADHRWGFCAFVCDSKRSAPSQTALDSFATKWKSVQERATWVRAPEVQRDDWDEARLRDLCAAHGWEFEWMTEDGERRRRVTEVGVLNKQQFNLPEKVKRSMRKHVGAASNAASKEATNSAISDLTSEGVSSTAGSEVMPDGYQLTAPTGTAAAPKAGGEGEAGAAAASPLPKSRSKQLWSKLGGSASKSKEGVDTSK